jgi:hypothetical protein
MLNIAYNTKRLDKIIKEWLDKKAFVEEQRAKRRGKPATNYEIQQAVEQYLGGDNYAEIAKRLFRSSGFIKAILARVGVPSRPAKANTRKVCDFIPDECVAEEFEPGEFVWSAKYHRPAKVIKEVSSAGDHLGRVYHIYILEAVNDPGPWFTHVSKGGYNAYQPAVDLGRIKHLEKYGVDLTRI